MVTPLIVVTWTVTLHGICNRVYPTLDTTVKWLYNERVCQLKRRRRPGLGVYVVYPTSGLVAGLVAVQEIFVVYRHLCSVDAGYVKVEFLAGTRFFAIASSPASSRITAGHRGKRR